MKIYIDTSSSDQAVVRVGDEELVRSSEVLHSQIVLPMIKELLQKKGQSLSDIDEIEVNPGPGSFTGLRVGATIGNALGYVLKVPVNGKKVWELEIMEPTYE